MPAINRDYFAGALMVVLGLGAVVEGSKYKIGNLLLMGAGFVPVVLGAALALIGLLIALGAAKGATQPTLQHDVVEPPDWRGAVCIVLGIVAFIALGAYAGLVPATFACVFISAMGDRATSWKGALALAAGVTLFGTLLFSYGLQVNLPLFGH
jgi:Tripartite tricarboxylate transporter TctB family